jgi:hypothetical protein
MWQRGTLKSRALKVFVGDPLAERALLKWESGKNWLLL